MTSLKHIASVMSEFLWNAPSFAEWFSDNGYHRFSVGDVLTIKYKNAVGYGIDSSIVIVDASSDEGGDRYIGWHVSLDYDEDAWRRHNFGFNEWMLGSPIPVDLQNYKVKYAKHFKSNVEMHFKKIGEVHPDLVSSMSDDEILKSINLCKFRN